MTNSKLTRADRRELNRAAHLAARDYARRLVAGWVRELLAARQAGPVAVADFLRARGLAQ